MPWDVVVVGRAGVGRARDVHGGGRQRAFQQRRDHENRRIRIEYRGTPRQRTRRLLLFAARAAALPETYRRYLINGLRETFDLPGTPIRLNLRAKANPFAKRTRR